MTVDMEHDQALWSEGPKTQSQTHTSNQKSMRDMDLLNFKTRVHLTDQVGALIGPLAPTPQEEGDGVSVDVEGCPCPRV